MIIKKLVFLCFSFLLLINVNAVAQLILADEPIPVTPKEFYITAVKATHPDANTKAISAYILQNFKRNRSLRPVVVTIQKYTVAETVLDDGRKDGYIYLTLSFGLQKDYGLEELLNYPGKLRYTRSATNQEAIARNLRFLIQTSLTYFNNWMNEQVDENRLLARNVKLRFTDYSDKLEGDTIYYSAKRPLTWADFQARSRSLGIYQAMVIPGLGYTQEVQLRKGTLEVTLAIKVFLPKSAAWAAATGRDDYALNHEQRHFDVAKIIAEQFKQRLSATKLTPDNFEGIINMQYLDALRDMNTMQKAYDRETSHGMNKIAQVAWNTRIDALLAIP
jgi:hypothetical protein